MTTHRSVTRAGLLVVSVAAMAGCVLPNYDLDRPENVAGQAGASGRNQGGQTGRTSAPASSASNAGTRNSTIQTSSNQAGAGGAEYASSAATTLGGTTATEPTGEAGTGPVSNSAGGSNGGGQTSGTQPIAYGGSGGRTSNAAAGSRPVAAGGSATGGASGAATGGVSGASTGNTSAAAGRATAGAPSASGGTATGGSMQVAGQSGTAAGAPNTGGIAGAAGAALLPCPSGRGPSMVRVPEGYCVDKTEVTEGQYTAWLNTNPSPIPANQIEVCAGNDDYASYWIRGVDNYPVVDIDWCDAVAFCTWAGKRLCGRIGGGAANYYTGYEDASDSEWYNACSSHGANVYPYGNTVIDTRCNAGKASVDTVSPVGEFNLCTSSVAGYTGIFDMSGNVWEWVDSCSGGADGYCRVAGSSYYRSVSEGIDLDPRCGLPAYEFRDSTFVNLGFRCCAD